MQLISRAVGSLKDPRAICSCGEFTVLDDVVVMLLTFNREVCGEFTVLADAIVTSAHVTSAIWLSRAS